MGDRHSYSDCRGGIIPAARSERRAAWTIEAGHVEMDEPIEDPQPIGFRDAASSADGKGLFCGAESASVTRAIGS